MCVCVCVGVRACGVRACVCVAEQIYIMPDQNIVTGCFSY